MQLAARSSRLAARSLQLATCGVKVLLGWLAFGPSVRALPAPPSGEVHARHDSGISQLLSAIAAALASACAAPGRVLSAVAELGISGAAAIGSAVGAGRESVAAAWASLTPSAVLKGVMYLVISLAGGVLHILFEVVRFSFAHPSQAVADGRDVAEV